jgi:hypothetical protein
MTMNMIRSTKMSADLADARRDFVSLARYAMISKGKTLDARAHAEAEGASPRVLRILQKAEPGMVSAGRDGKLCRILWPARQATRSRTASAS